MSAADIPVPQVPGLDLADAMARMDLSFSEMKELLVAFPAAVREEMVKLRAASAGGDLTAVRFAAHALAGLAGNYGAKALWAAAKEVETAARDGRGGDIGPILARVCVLADEAAAGAESILAN